MGIKTGTFKGRNGHQYKVALVGGTVTTGTITLGVPPVIISMAPGQHKFCGFKSTTATVNIITDVPLVELYGSSVTDIRLTVENLTLDKVEFDGYVTPFAFDQPYTGKNDSVTVNAVDLLTARKDVEYTNFSADYGAYGTDRYAIDIIAEIAYRAGITTVVEHINFDVTTTSPLAVKVAQAGFLQDKVGELDALSAICKFFGMTACCVGTTLYLYDEHCLLYAAQGKNLNANVYNIANGKAERTAQHYDSQATPLADQYVAVNEAHNDISVTIERAYDGVQIKPDGSETSILLPDVCADENLEWLPDSDNALGASTREKSYTDGTVIYRRPMVSKILDCGKGGASAPTAWPENVDNYGDYLRPDESVGGGAKPWNTGAIPLRYVKAKTEEVSGGGYTGYAPIVSTEMSNLIWLRVIDGGQYAFKQKMGYSHTGGYIEMKASAIVSDVEDYNLLTHTNNGFWLAWLQLSAGNKHLKYDSNLAYVDEGWGDSMSYYTAIQLSEDGSQLASSLRGAEMLMTGKVIAIPNDGQIRVDGYLPTASTAFVQNFFIKSLSIEAVGDKINEEHSDMLFVQGNGDDKLEVSTILTTRDSGITRTDISENGSLPYGVNARPSVVPQRYWNGGYMGRAQQEAIPISGILMEQLKERYAQPRICYKMTVGKNIQPFAAVYFGSGRYTVEAYERDLYNSTTTITID